MINKTKELHDIAIKAIFTYAEEIVPTDLDQDEAQAVIRDELCHPAQIPPLSVAQTDQASTSVFKKAERAIAGLFSRLSLRNTSGAEKADIIAKAIATQTKACTECRLPMLSFSVVVKPKVAHYKRELRKQKRLYGNSEVDLHSMIRAFEYDKMMRDKTTRGTKIAEDVYVKINPDWEGVEWAERPGTPVHTAMYNVIVFEKDRSLENQLLVPLRDRLEEMGYVVQYTHGKFDFSYEYFYRITWIDEEEWEKIVTAAADPYAIEAWNAGVPLDDIVI